LTAVLKWQQFCRSKIQLEETSRERKKPLGIIADRAKMKGRSQRSHENLLSINILLNEKGGRTQRKG
jgi:hypothetical protein